MKQFAWRLQKILDLRTGQEQLKRTELVRITEQLAGKRGALLMYQRILQDLLAQIKREKRGHSTFSPGAGPGGPSSHEPVECPLFSQRWQAQEFLLRHAAADDERIRRLQEEIAALEVQRKEKTAEVLAVRRCKEGLEKLREQAKEEYLHQQEQFAQKELDERIAVAHMRSRTGE